MVTSRKTSDEAAAEIRALWDTLTPPPLTTPEAKRAAKKLYRYSTGHTWEGQVIAGVTQVRFNGWKFGVPVQGTHIAVSAKDGWEALVHHLADDITYAFQGDLNTCELAMVREVIKRGWMDGRLCDRVAAPLTKEQRAANKRRDAVVRIKQRIKAWTTKHKRATTALKKLNAQLKRMEKKRTHNATG